LEKAKYGDILQARLSIHKRKNRKKGPFLTNRGAPRRGGGGGGLVVGKSDPKKRGATPSPHSVKEGPVLHLSRREKSWGTQDGGGGEGSSSHCNRPGGFPTERRKGVSTKTRKRKEEGKIRGFVIHDFTQKKVQKVDEKKTSINWATKP